MSKKKKGAKRSSPRKDGRPVSDLQQLAKCYKIVKKYEHLLGIQIIRKPR